MQLAWTDRDEIAKALMQAHPDADRLALSLDDVKAMVVALPGFSDAPEPPRPAYVEAVLWTWMRLADAAEDTGGGNDNDGGDAGGDGLRCGAFSAVAGGG